MCNFMVPDHMNYWKEVGINLGVHKAKLDAIEFEKLNKANKCCYEMLAKWLECDVNATMEKLKKVVRSLSDSKTMVLSSDLLVNFKKYLQQRYAHMSINNIANIAYIYHQCKVGTNESVRAVAKATYYGNIVIDCDQCNNQQLFSQSNQVTDYYAKCAKNTNILNLLIELDKPDLAPVRDKPFLLLIEGAQGMGKTAICKEIAHQWTKHRGLVGQFTFLICLNEINPAYIRSFRAFLEYLCSENQPGTIKALLGNLHSNRGDKVMVIIDGYENLFAQQKYSVDSFIHKIINREISVLQQCDLVISSCHTASVKLYNCNNCTKIELVGFTKEAKQQYIDNALDHTQENTDELMAYLNEHKSLNSLCYYPLCLKELVYLFRQSKFSNSKLLTSEAEIINRITNRIVLSLSESKKMDCLPLTTAFRDMSKELQFTLKTIGKLAFYSLQTKDYTFKLSDLERGINSEDVKKCCSNGLGFLKVINFFDNTDINQMLFTFLHYALQEFLAAFYLSTLSQNNCIEIYKQTFWKSEYINVWAYYCDITRDNNIIKKMVLGSWRWLGFQKLPGNILQDKMSCLYLVHCFTESPYNEIYQEVKSKVICDDTTLDLSSYNFSEEDFHKVVLYLSHSKVQQWINLDLSYCYIDDNKLACFFQKLQPFMKSLPGIRVLNLSNNQLSRISIRHTLTIAAIFNTVKIMLSCNEIQDQELCKSVISFVEKSNDSFRIKVIHNCRSFFLLRSQDLLQDLKLDSNLTCLYVIRCSLQNDEIDSLVQVLKSSDTLSLVFFYENNLNHRSLVKTLNEFKVIKQLKNVLIFEKKLSDISIDETNFRVFLLSTSIKLLAYKAVDHQILMALEYNPSIVHLQLNDCHITDEVMSKIAVILNNSSQQWSLLDLSGSNIGDESFAIFRNELDGNSAVSSLNLTSNKLTSLSLISKLIQCLNPKVFDISRNGFTNEVANSTSLPISMMVAEKLFTQEKRLSLTLTCDNDIVLYCHKLSHAITAESVPGVSNNFTQVFVNDCTITVEMLLRLLHSNDSLIFLHLAHVKWSGESLYNLPEFFKIDIFLSICKNSIPKQIVNNVVKMFDADVSISRIISTHDIFIAHRCSYELLKGYLTWQLLPLPSTKSLFYIRNCSLDTKHQNCNVVTDYLCTQSIVTEIVLCNNGLSQNNIQRMIKKFLQLKMPIFKYIFICELQQQLYGTMTARWLFKKFNCSFIIIEGKAFIGRKTTSVQIERCLSLASPVTTFNILRFINCRFFNEHYDTLAGIISHHENLKEFSLYECNTNYLSTKMLVDPLQMKSTLTSLLLSCNKVTPMEADSIATSLSTVISNNCALEKVSFKIDGLHSSACSKIFEALSNIEHLKSFRFCDAQITTKEAVFQLKKVIANNPSLKIVNLRNNKLQSSGVKAVTKGFGSICHLKLLALNGNQIDEEAADDIASVINKNLEIEKLLLYNNALKSEGVSKICQALKYHSHLQVFRIGHNYLQEEAADDIAEVINHNPLLKIVDIGGNRLLTRGVMKIANSLEKATNLQTLSCNESYITCTNKAATSIGRVVKNNTSLKALHLDNNNFSVSDISTIAESLNELTGLKELTVNNTGFTADHITAMISNNLLLETLDIGDNQLKSVGICNVSKALIKLNRLKVLGLYGNEITDDAASDIAVVIYNLPLLEKLLLNNNMFGVVGIQTICKSLQRNGMLKLLQLNNVGITEEVADDIAAVIDGNPLLQCIYLESNRLQNSGANVILGSLSNKKHIKALSLANNNISEVPVDKMLQFITNNELDELLLNNNSFGTTGIFNICKCIKDNINTLRVFSFADTNVSDEATDAIISVIESNNALEKISVDGNILMLDDDKLLTAIAKLSNLKCLQINFKVFTVNTVYRLVDFVFTNNKIEELTFNNLVEEIHLLSSLNPVETIVVIKTNVNELSSCKPIVHSVIMENKIEIVCKKDDVLIESEVIKIINAKICQRLMLVFTRMNCYTDQEMNVLVNNVADCKIINSLVISKLSANEYNSDVSGIVIIEGSEMIVMLTDDSLTGTGITKLLHKVENITSLILCTDRESNFSDPSINEIVDLISNATKLCKFIVRNNSIHVKAMENIINCFTESITTKTIKVLNELNIRNFDFIQKNDNSLFVEEIDKPHWHNILCALKHRVDLKILDLSGNAINGEVAQHLSILLNGATKLELLNLKECFLGMNLNDLQKVTTLKYLDLSDNYLTKVEPIRAILKCNTGLEQLYIEKNCLQCSAGDSLSVHIVNLKCLKVLGIDQNIISRNMALKLAFSFSTITERTLYIYNHDYQTVEGLKIIGSFNIINTLTLCKVPIETEDQVIIKTFIENGSVIFRWSHCNVQNITGVLKFLCSLKQITTINLVNISENEFTKLEIDAIATVISDNVQLQYLWLGRQSYRAITKDSVGFKEEFNFSSDGLSKDEMQKQNWQFILSEKSTKPTTYKLHLFLCSEVLINMFSNSVNLKTLDLSGNVITEELAQQLAIALTNSTQLEALLLEDCSLGNKGVNLIADSLKDLTHLDLSNNEITEYQALNSILKSNVTLQKLYLEKNCLDCTAGDKMIISIVNLKCLKVLSIDQNIISRNVTLKLATAFSTDIKRKLFIYNHDYQCTEVLDIRGSLHNITTLTLCKCSVDVPLVTAVLETGTVLIRWYQSHALNTTGVLQFFSAFKNITTIKLHKFASDSEFTLLEVDIIASIISDNLPLANLWLGSHSCKVVHDDINVLINKPINFVDHSNDLDLLPQKLQLIPQPLLFKILSALKYYTNLKTLDLSGNVITDELAELLAIVLDNVTKLETLLLRNCSLSSIGTYVIANSIKNIITLKQLSLSWNNITKVTAECLETLIECNTGLSKLYLDGSLQCVSKHSTAAILYSIKKLNLELLQIDCEVIAKDITCELVDSLINNGKFKCLILKNHSLQVTGIIKFENYSKEIKSLIVIRTTEQDSTSVTASIEASKIIVMWSQDNVLASTGVSRIVGVVFKGLTSVSWVNLTFNDYTDTDVDDIITLTTSFTELEELVVVGYSTALQNYIFDSLNKLNNLKRFDLTLSKFHANAMAKLPSFLLNHCEIQELKLNFCLFKSFQIAEIINVLKTHTCLQSLGLFDANITDVLSIVHDIGQVLQRNQGMCKFYIGNNRLQVSGITKILEVLKQFHNLTELSIGRNITDEISDSIVKKKLYDFLAEVITNNLKLEVLGIDYVCLHADGAVKVVKALKSLSCLKVLDISGNNINTETTDDIADVITNNPNLVKLFVANNYIEITTIADALVNTKILEVLDFSNNNISSGAAESLSKIVSNNPQLKVLLLGWEKTVIEHHSKAICHNNTSNSGISTTKLSSVFINVQMLIIKLHTKGNIMRLISATCIIKSSIFCSKLFSEGFKTPFNYNQLQSEGIKKISKALTGIKSLEILSIENNDVDDEAVGDIATALASNTGIKQLWIGQNNFTSSGISVILQSLIGNLQLSLLQSLPEVTINDKPTLPTLLVLNLSYSNLSLTAVRDISAVLSKNCCIQQVWLEGNNLSSQSIANMADALKKCMNILVLSLRDNNINEEAADSLSDALSEKFDLQQLYLGNNQLEDRGVIRISEALNTTHGLLTLDLMNNNISEAAADALASVITSCSQLEQLYLGDNKLHSTGTIRIATAIQQANCRSTLRVLDLSNNGIGSDETVADEISRAVANTEILTVLILDDNALSIDGLLKITRSVAQSESAEWMMIFSVKRNGVVIGEEAEHEMRPVMNDQRLADCNVFITTLPTAAAASVVGY